MIRAVSSPEGRLDLASAAFLSAAAAQPLPGVELASAWYAFGSVRTQKAEDWHFYTAGAAEERFALGLRGGAGWACGRHDPEELGEFLHCVRARRLTLREGEAAPAGFVPAERMLGYQMPCPAPVKGRGKPALPPVPAGYRLMREHGAARLAWFLRQEGAFALPGGPGGPASPEEEAAQDAACGRFSAELNGRLAVGLASPAVLLDAEGEVAAALAFTTTAYAKMVCLSAIQVRADLQGRGLGGWLARRAAAEAHRLGRGLCLLCRPERAGFYERMGFLPEGRYCCYAPEAKPEPAPAPQPGPNPQPGPAAQPAPAAQ